MTLSPEWAPPSHTPPSIRGVPSGAQGAAMAKAYPLNARPSRD